MLSTSRKRRGHIYKRSPRSHSTNYKVTKHAVQSVQRCKRCQRTVIPVDRKDNMNKQEILIELDAEIARLQQARHLLMDGKGKAARSAKRTGRPKSPETRARMAAGQKKRWGTATKAAKKRAGHTMSPEARAKISAGQKKRWAEAKKSVK